jgi:hypothetical protein
MENERGAVDLALLADSLNLVEQAVGHTHGDEGDAFADLRGGKVLRLVCGYFADGDGARGLAVAQYCEAAR